MRKLTYIITAVTVGAATLGALAVTGSLGNAQATAKAKTAKAAATTRGVNDELIPDEVTNLKAEWDMSANGMVISFTAPTTGYSFDYTTWDDISGPLTSIRSIEVALWNGYNTPATELKSFANPAPGEELSYVETGLERGKTYTFIVTVYANDESSEGAMTEAVLAGGVPALPSDLDVNTAEGKMPFTLSFTAPATYSDGITPLESIAKGEIWTQGGWYDSPVLVADLGDITPGNRVEYEINDPKLSGEQKWALMLYSQDGPSEKLPFNFYVGTDTPGMVSDLKAVETEPGKVLLSWGEPTKGSRGGYFNRSELKYDVKVLTPGNWGDDAITVSSAQTEKEYLYTLEGTDPKQVRFSVTAATGAGYGTENQTGYMVVGPALTLPFTEGFDTKASEYEYTYDHLWGTSTTCSESYPPKWRISEYCYDGSTKVTPANGSGALIYLSPYSSTPISDFILTSSKISVSDAAALNLSYRYYVPAGNTGGTSVSASVSFDNGATFSPLNSVLFADCTEKGWQTAEVSDIPVPAGASAALLRLSARNSKEACVIALDDIRLRAVEALPDVYPASVSDFTATLNSDATAINVSLTAPTLTHPSLGDVNSQPLTAISRIVLLRQVGYANPYEQVCEFLSPAPGASLTYSDTDIATPGEYYYKAIVYVGERCDYGNYIDNPIMIGQIPADITDLTLTTARGAAPVTVRFRLPSTDWKGEPLHEIPGVMISRYNTDTFVWDNLCHLTDNLVPGEYVEWNDANVTLGEIYEYRVVCEGTAGNAYGTNGSVYVGADAPEEPTDLVATIDAEGLVHLSWNAPTRGMNNGYIDAEHLTYVIQRGNGYSDYNAELLQSGVTETTWTDPTGWGDEEIVKYFVKAVSGQMAGYSAISNTLLVGDPTTLPFNEPFNKVVGEEIQPVYSTWTIESTETSSVWAFAELAYFMMEGQIRPVDNDGGLAYAFYGPYNTLTREDYLLSGNMDVRGISRPGLSFNFYAVPGYDSSLRVEVSIDGDDFEPVYDINFDGGCTEMGWQKVSMPLDLPDGSTKIRLRFVAGKGAYSCSVAVDNVSVTREYDDSGVKVEKLDGVMVWGGNGCLTVAGLNASEAVTVSDLGGCVRYNGHGDCRLPLEPGLYLVTLRNKTLKVRL